MASHQPNAAERRFRGVGLPTVSGPSFDVVVQQGNIVSFEHHSSAPVKWLLFPPFADLHVHANRAFTAGTELATSLEHAIRLAYDVFRHFSEADYARQSSRFFAQAIRMGTTRVRTHADIHADNPLAAVRGTLAAAEQFRERLDVETVAFAASSCDPTDRHVNEMMREACRLGAGFVGAAPAHHANPRASIDALLDLATALDVLVDVHLDEHLDITRSCSEYLALATIERGLQGRVTLSHGCAIAMLDPEARARVAGSLARAGITVIALPTTNLYLQGRADGTPQHRGLTAVGELAAAGVPLRFASDNVRDGFFPYGAADLLDIAYLVALVAQINNPELLVRGICGGISAVPEGSAANFVLVPGASFAQALAERPQERVVVRGGVVMEPLPAP